MEVRSDREKSPSPGAEVRRRASSSSGTSWLRKLSKKVTGNSDNEPASPNRRRSSAGSIFSIGSEDSDQEDMPKISKWRSATNSISDRISLLPRTTQGNHDKRAYRESSHLRSPPPGDIVNDIEYSRPSSPKSKRMEQSAKDTTLGDLKKRKINTRAVGFAVSIYGNDPPQKIPPVSPAIGNIQFLSNGDLQLRKPKSNSNYPAYLQEKHTQVCHLAQKRAAENAERLHLSIDSGKHGLSAVLGSRLSSPTSEGDYEEPKHFKNVDGQTPAELQSDAWHAPELTRTSRDDEADQTPSPEDVYTRCCHLREIMPIKNILRQIKGQLVPIPSLRVANTKPTLVEIEAFSDFLTAVPVVGLGLDNHVFSDEMVRLILAGLSRSRDIVRISFRNTVLSPLGWQYLCSFIATCKKSLIVLDLSCSNPTEAPHRIEPFDRRGMDWNLLTEALSVMGCLEELDLGGTKIPRDSLRRLLNSAFKRGKILSLAYNELNHEDVAIVEEWAQRPEETPIGIDLSGNDLHRDADWKLVQSFISNVRIERLKLRKVGLNYAHAMQLTRAITPAEASQCKLKSLDLSDNPGLFPDILGNLSSVLHRYPNLVSFQVENCGLLNDNIVMLCEALSHCHKLVHVSFKGNCVLNETAATALSVAVHLSESICTVEADIPDKFATLKNQLTSYCLQNLERNAGRLGAKAESSSDHGELSDIQTFHEELRSVAAVINNDPKTATKTSDELISRMDTLKSRVTIRMQSLLFKRRHGPLSVSDREATIRLFFLSTTLERLKREISGLPSQEATNSEEKVSAVDVEEERPSIARQASIQSLKQLEREEAESHRRYSGVLSHISDDAKLHEAVEKLNVNDLGKIIGE